MPRFLPILVLSVLPLATINMAHGEEKTVWIGMGAPRHGEPEGIYRAILNLESGALSKPELAAELKSAGFLTLSANRKRLYSICRLEKTGGVAAFEISSDGRMLRLMNAQPIGDGEACHLALEATGRLLFTAQYGAGTVAVFPLDADGRVQPRSALVRHTGSGPNLARQEGPHPHWVGTDPGNRFLFVPDLGSDQIVIYSIDLNGGAIQPHGTARCNSGAGPRHMKFHPSGRFAYVINELDLSVTVFGYQAESGSLEPLQTITTLPEAMRKGAVSGSEIRVHSSGQFVYAANRGHDSIAAFKVDEESGRLTFVEHEAVRGVHPRNFNIDPSGNWLLAAGRDSNTISVFRIDPATGALSYTGTTVNSPAPICVAF